MKILSASLLLAAAMGSTNTSASAVVINQGLSAASSASSAAAAQASLPADGFIVFGDKNKAIDESGRLVVCGSRIHPECVRYTLRAWTPAEVKAYFVAPQVYLDAKFLPGKSQFSGLSYNTHSGDVVIYYRLTSTIKRDAK